MLQYGYNVNGPAGGGTPRDPVHRKVGTLPVDATKDTAHPFTPEERPCICYGGLVFIGRHELTEEGEEVEVVEPVPCRRCAADAQRSWHRPRASAERCVKPREGIGPGSTT